MTEREKFEQWASMPPREWPLHRICSDSTHYISGEYVLGLVQNAWIGWQARADAFTHKAIYEDEV